MTGFEGLADASVKAGSTAAVELFSGFVDVIKSVRQLLGVYEFRAFIKLAIGENVRFEKAIHEDDVFERAIAKCIAVEEIAAGKHAIFERRTVERGTHESAIVEMRPYQVDEIPKSTLESRSYNPNPAEPRIVERG